VSPVLVRAYRERFTLAELQGFLDEALKDLAAGVKITSINSEGHGGAGALLKGDPETIAETLQVAIEEVTEAETQSAGGGMGSHVSFEGRRTET